MNRSISLLSLVSLAACLPLLTANATSYYLNVGLTDHYALGEVLPPVIGGTGGQTANDVTMSSTLVTMYNGSPRVYSEIIGSSTYSLSHNNLGALSAPVSSGAVLGSGVGSGSGNVHVTTIGGNAYAVITLTGSGYGYLVGRYDGNNAGAEVWDISSLAAGSTIYIPEYAYPSNGTLVMGNGQYQITGWTLLSPNAGIVPDSGVTLAMFGSALSGLALLRRKLC